MLWLSVMLGATGCVTGGPTGRTRFDIPIVTNVERLGVAPLQARAAIVVPKEEQLFKVYAPIPMGAWDFQWGRSLSEASRSAFSQVFQSVAVTENPDESADYEVRLSFDRTKTAANVTFRGAAGQPDRPSGLQ